MSLRDIFDKILKNNLNFKIQDAIDILLVATAIYGLLVLTERHVQVRSLRDLAYSLCLHRCADGSDFPQCHGYSINS